ncbi:TlpA family protein disulfide reductase [Lutibacter sp. B1]|uniref:TlpA family protein disulfide reductase n=1 Tax=Lutibacter sp. B1 TaxID=2725996 RepID=UPI00145631E3|nr:TlpA family protein disulfide reductase [Lutibacter sp. B1]NLP59180.1 redoxin domain-containing protein [Lutibacter sp. B1]
MERLLLIVCIAAFVSCKTEPKQSENISDEKKLPEKVITIPSYTYETLEPLLHKEDDKTYVINFWATWCKPCVEELPAFEKLNATYKNQNVEVILVSLDFQNQIEKRVIPFIQENNIQSEVVIMVDPDQNTWIPKISKKWSGAIPATLIYNKHKREFYEQSFTYELLQNELKKF